MLLNYHFNRTVQVPRVLLLLKVGPEANIQHQIDQFEYLTITIYMLEDLLWNFIDRIYDVKTDDPQDMAILVLVLYLVLVLLVDRLHRQHGQLVPVPLRNVRVA
jgi:hypothetical protein